jgi:HEPN domain-containing protein
MNELTAEWVAKAEDDLAAAGLLLRGGEHPLPDLSCFHSQQCAEKYLKAFLQEQRVRFERTHDLVALLNLCSTVDDELETLREDVNRLGNFAS